MPILLDLFKYRRLLPRTCLSTVGYIAQRNEQRVTPNINIHIHRTDQFDTPQVAWSASVKGFLREFDSIEIREGATVEGQLYARRFEASHMNVMPILVGTDATVASGAVVYGGTSIGERW